MYTIIIDKDERALNNWYNENIRHCRIGKVTPKPPKHWTGSKLLDGLKGQPIFPSFPSTSPMPNTSYPPAWWQNPVVSEC